MTVSDKLTIGSLLGVREDHSVLLYAPNVYAVIANDGLCLYLGPRDIKKMDHLVGAPWVVHDCLYLGTRYYFIDRDRGSFVEVVV